MSVAVLDQYSALQSCQIHITYDFQSSRITAQQGDQVNFATIQSGENTRFPLKSTKEPCLHCKTKGPNAEAHPPSALGRDVHFCHSILQHVNICPGQSPARAGQVVPTASRFTIHACRLCFLLHNAALTLSEQPSPAGPSTHSLIYWLSAPLNSKHSFIIIIIMMAMCHTESVTINTVNKVGDGGVRELSRTHVFITRMFSSSCQVKNKSIFFYLILHVY